MRVKGRKPGKLVAADVMPLYPWQNEFIQSKSRLKALLKSRQIGGSTVGTLAVAVDAMINGESYNTMSRTGRQAKRLLQRILTHSRAIDMHVRNSYGTKSLIQKATSEEIVYYNNASVSCVPCDADTTVGDTTNWLLDEMALYPDSDRTFGIIKPSIMHGKKMMIISSPRGTSNKFYKLYQSFQDGGKEKSGWDFFKITIEDAINDGMVVRDHLGEEVDFETFKQQEIRDVGYEMWMQEYMCSFHNLASAVVSYETIESCATLPSDDPMQKSPTQIAQLANHGMSIYMGIDVGRFRDLTVIWIIGQLPDGSFRTLSAIPLENEDMPTQISTVEAYLSTGQISCCCIDYMGVGIGLVDALMIEYSGTVEKVLFTNQSKMEMAQRLVREMQGRNFSIFNNDELVDDFARVEKIVTDQGNTRLEARRGGKSHGDYFWAACLALKAATCFGQFEVVIA